MYFQDSAIFTSQQVNNGKPAPDLFLFAAKQMNHISENCLVIEDSSAGITAAISANMKVIGFLGGSHAQYNWYRQKINCYGIPTIHQERDLIEKLEHFIEK